MIYLDEAIKYVEVRKLPTEWRREWEESFHFYKLKKEECLKPGFLEEAQQLIGFPEDIYKALKRAYAILRGDPVTQRVVIHCHFLLFRKHDYPINALMPWLAVKERLEGDAGLFPVLILLTGIPHIRNFYEEKQIPESILKDTLSDLVIWIKDYQSKYGHFGFNHLFWLMHHFQGKLFRLGRLQFVPSSFHGEIKVYRNLYTGSLKVLSSGGVKFRPDGQVDGTNDIFANDRAWFSIFVEDDESIQGCPIHPNGYALFERIILPKNTYELELQKGDPILDIHIPAGEKLTRQSCLDSYHKAVDFFRRYFPEISPKGFSCQSWLLDNQLTKILPSTSNIVQFQQDYYGYPFLTDDFQTFERVFGNKPQDYGKVDCKTPLQKSIIDFVKKGNNMRMGAGFFLKKEGPQPGYCPSVE